MKQAEPTLLNDASEVGFPPFVEVSVAACDAAAAVRLSAWSAVHDMALLVLPCDVVDPHLDPLDDL